MSRSLHIKITLKVLLSALLLYGGFYLFISHTQKDRIDVLLKEDLYKLQTHYEIAMSYSERIADAVYKFTNDDAFVTEVLKRVAEDNVTKEQRDAERARLQAYLQPFYDSIKLSHVLQYQFVLRDNVSFLRMHKPEKFDDNLSNIRYSFFYVNKHTKKIKGFEQGRTAHAFRYVYPIFENNTGKHLCSLEVSFSSDGVQDDLIDANIYSHFLVDKNIFDVKAWEREDLVLNYIPAIEHKDYMFTVSKNLTRLKNLKIYKESIIDRLQPQINQGIASKEPFSLYTSSNGAYWIVSFLPIKNIKDKKVVAYIISYKKDTYIEHVFSDYTFANRIFILLLILVMFFFYRNLYKSQLLIVESRKQKQLSHLLRELNNSLEDKIKQAVKDNLAKDKLLQEQSKIALMGDMLGSVSHHWRQPLNVLNINIENLESDYEDGLLSKEFLDEFIDEQTHIIRSLAHTIDNFRNYFHIDKKKSRFYVKDTIFETFHIEKVWLDSYAIDYSVIGDDFELYGYKSEFKQVILNLISNAKDAIIFNNITKGYIKIILEGSKVIVEDNGGGIAKEIQERIFEPYFSTKEEGSGIGLGLYISKVIVQKNMKGNLFVENLDGGTRFIVAFKSKSD